ncbi:unnamed protein product [Caenorhabditis angaria]|uniref:Uncharacterized protein n=1 Tax=Caenorhabditis angaria TaxID=860376 RepID=A0A9P1IFK8_9PELO|nr:unnamed protein product [Caenorhabditis angaria]
MLKTPPSSEKPKRKLEKAQSIETSSSNRRISGSISISPICFRRRRNKFRQCQSVEQSCSNSSSRKSRIENLRIFFAQRSSSSPLKKSTETMNSLHNLAVAAVEPGVLRKSISEFVIGYIALIQTSKSTSTICQTAVTTVCTRRKYCSPIHVIAHTQAKVLYRRAK